MRRPFYLLTKNIPLRSAHALEAIPSRSKQVLLNLVMNSIQAMPAGGQIEISARIEDDDVCHRSEGSRDGVFRLRRVDRIFDPFFTTHEHRLGLGLRWPCGS